MTPFSFKSVAARLNIYKDNGPVLKSIVVVGDGFNWGGWYGTEMVVDGFVVSIWSFGTITCGRMSSSSEVCDS